MNPDELMHLPESMTTAPIFRDEPVSIPLLKLQNEFPGCENQGELLVSWRDGEITVALDWYPNDVPPPAITITEP